MKIKLALLAAFFLTTSLVYAETSETNERLKRVLKRFPEADANKDGILTMDEAKAFRDQRGAGGAKKGRKNKNWNTGPVTVSGSDVKEDQAIKGRYGLYMGHSFFVPTAKQLLKVIPDTQVVDHTGCIIMSGGPTGSPKILWETELKRTAGQKHLDTGKVELLAMTYYSPENSAVEHYSKWFDYAIEKNPKIDFMVAIPWGPEPHKATVEELPQAGQRYQELYETLVVALRKKYPQNRVFFCPYGFGVYELIERLHKGNLPGVKHVLNPDKAARKESQQKKEQLTNDELGHGGELIAHLSSLLWLQTIYNCDITALKAQRVEGLPDIDLNEISAKVHKKIVPFNADYEAK